MYCLIYFTSKFMLFAIIILFRYHFIEDSSSILEKKSEDIWMQLSSCLSKINEKLFPLEKRNFWVLFGRFFYIPDRRPWWGPFILNQLYCVCSKRFSSCEWFFCRKVWSSFLGTWFGMMSFDETKAFGFWELLKFWNWVWKLLKLRKRMSTLIQAL